MSCKKNFVVVGWLHRADIKSKYKRVQLQHGGGTRRIEYLPDEASAACLLEKAKQLFFPGGESQKGHLSNMKSELGNFQHEIITSFRDREENVVTLPEYLKSYGLYSGRTYLFLMTTENEPDEDSLGDVEEVSSASSTSSVLKNQMLLPSSAEVMFGESGSSIGSITTSMSASLNTRTANSEQ